MGNAAVVRTRPTPVAVRLPSVGARVLGSQVECPFVTDTGVHAEPTVRLPACLSTYRQREEVVAVAESLYVGYGITYTGFTVKVEAVFLYEIMRITRLYFIEIGIGFAAVSVFKPSVKAVWDTLRRLFDADTRPGCTSVSPPARACQWA